MGRFVMKFILKASLIMAGLFYSVLVQAQEPELSCETLASKTITNGNISSAELIPAGDFDASGSRASSIYKDLGAFCRISAILSPVQGSNIHIEVWMPVQNWNSKLVAVGNGGLAGTVSHDAMAEAVVEGFAAVSTDTGHVGGDPAFLENEVLLTDFAHRAIHEMTVAAKALVTDYYSSSPRFTYFNGCSTGGRQALTAVQRYPTDFDGVVAGAPANSTLRMTMQQLWNSRIVNDTAGLELGIEDFSLLNNAVMAACDALDGLQDGIIENPSICMADPIAVDGLSGLEVEALRKIYQGAVNPESGEIIYPGFAKGSELGWTAMVNRRPFGYSNDMQSYVVNQDPEWDFLNLDFARDLSVLDSRLNALGIQAIDPDISEFINHGGKLLLYHGWNDPLISPFNTINYYQQVQASLGSDANNAVSLFMMPAVNHCRGGNGFDSWSKLEVIDSWRESGIKPQSIEAAHIENEATITTRPLCAYPGIAIYTGNGSSDSATSFQCQ
tara:strand:- start:532 stop:2031 length:1500 start_codon:yes stop_codon:yes gene_type:complete